MIKHLLMDCDGVLVDTERPNMQFWIDKLSNYVEKNTLEEWLHKNVGIASHIMLKKLLEDFKIDLSDQQVQKLEIEKNQYLNSVVQTTPNLKEALKNIALTKSVVSNSSSSKLNTRLEIVKIKDHFKHIFSGLDVPNPKPAPDVYLHAIKVLEKDGIQKDEILVVEDSIVGITAALKAGLKIVAYVGVCIDKEESKQKIKDLGIKTIFDNMLNLPSIIEAEQ